MFHKKHKYYLSRVTKLKAPSIMSTRSIGNIGENIACKYLETKGFSVIESNYLKKWGEIDIIAHEKVAHETKRAKKDVVTHFFEVKSVKGEHWDSLKDGFHPEDNVHAFKVKHIRRMIETYMSERGFGLESEFQFHVLCVYMNMKTHRARVKWLRNVIL